MTHTPLQFYNSLTKTKEIFVPLKAGHVGMYVCGPTVYDRAHIGNARAIVIFDTLYRVLSHSYGIEHVTYVRNITDVDDKINARAKEQHISIQELTDTTTGMFHHDMSALNCYPLHFNADGSKRIEPKATEHIDSMISMCETLIANGHAYANQSHVLFDITSYEGYGKLSRRSMDDMIAGARVEVAPYKKNAGDFVLWKPSNPDEPGWDSPWGRGRPGWHLECSAMSTQYLGETFDIHGGGADLQFPHHENEIAQSCCTYPNSHFAKLWIHNGFLTVNGEKMSKSLGNFITVNQLLDENIQGEVIRLALLSTHYRKPLDWTDKGLADAAKAMQSFYRALHELNEERVYSSTDIPAEFVTMLYDDLNTPQAIAYLHQLVTQINKTNSDEKTTLMHRLKACGQLMGLLYHSSEQWFDSHAASPNQTAEIEALIAERNQARHAKNWAEADRIRDTLKAMSITISDNPDGTTSWQKE